MVLHHTFYLILETNSSVIYSWERSFLFFEGSPERATFEPWIFKCKFFLQGVLRNMLKYSYSESLMLKLMTFSYSSDATTKVSHKVIMRSLLGKSKFRLLAFPIKMRIFSLPSFCNFLNISDTHLLVRKRCSVIVRCIQIWCQLLSKILWKQFLEFQLFIH